MMVEDEVARQSTRDALARSLWGVAIAMAIHELEEWNIARWSARNFTNHTGISDYAIWIGVATIAVLFAGWILIATRMRNATVMALIALPPVALVAVGNSVQHVTWTVLFREYAPGVVSAVLLVVPAAGYAMWRMVEANRMLLVPLAGCGVLWVVASVQVVDTGRELAPFQLVLQRFFIGFAELLGLPGVTPAA